MAKPKDEKEDPIENPPFDTLGEEEEVEQEEEEDEVENGEEHK